VKDVFCQIQADSGNLHGGLLSLRFDGRLSFSPSWRIDAELCSGGRPFHHDPPVLIVSLIFDDNQHGQQIKPLLPVLHTPLCQKKQTPHHMQGSSTIQRANQGSI
jgi:hypothetical protein